MTNEEALQKAQITSDALATAGALNTVQADKFIDFVIDESTLLKNCRVVRLPKGASWEIDKIGVGRRVALPAVEAKDPNLRRGVTTSKVTITPCEIMVPVEIGDQFKRLNIQGDQVETAVMQMFARQTQNDIEEQALLGDTLGPAILESDYFDGGDSTRYRKDSYLAQQAGFLRLADSANIVDAAGANIGASIFRQGITALPTKFRRNRGALRWLAPSDLLELWREKVSGRATAAGDDALGGGNVPKPFGIPALDCPLFPFAPKVVEHVVVNGVLKTSLRYKPIADVVVSRSTLGITPETAYILNTDYEVDLVNGTINRKAGSAIGDGATIKVTYTVNPQMLLTVPNNLIAVISKDITIEKARDIYRRMNQYAITMIVGFGIEETSAMVKIKNFGTGV
jgi:hypothetical protein